MVVAGLTRLTLSLCSVSCLMFPCKETLLDCEGETQPLTLPLHPATARPLSYLQPHRALCMSVLLLPFSPGPPPPPSCPASSIGRVAWCFAGSVLLKPAVCPQRKRIRRGPSPSRRIKSRRPVGAANPRLPARWRLQLRLKVRLCPSLQR